MLPGNMAHFARIRDTFKAIFCLHMLCWLFEVFDCLPPQLPTDKEIYVFIVCDTRISSVKQYSVYVCCAGYLRSLIALIRKYKFSLSICASYGSPREMSV